MSLYSENGVLKNRDKGRCVIFHAKHNTKHYEYRVIQLMGKGIALKCCSCNAKLSLLFNDNIKTENVSKDGLKTKNCKLSEDVTAETMRDISNYTNFVRKCGNFSCEGHKLKQTIRRDFRQKVRCIKEVY